MSPEQSKQAQKLVDACQVAAILSNRIAISAQQQALDAAQLVQAVERAVAALKAQIAIEKDASEKGGA